MSSHCGRWKKIVGGHCRIVQLSSWLNHLIFSPNFIHLYSSYEVTKSIVFYVVILLIVIVNIWIFSISGPLHKFDIKKVKKNSWNCIWMILGVNTSKGWLSQSTSIYIKVYRSRCRQKFRNTIWQKPPVIIIKRILPLQLKKQSIGVKR